MTPLLATIPCPLLPVSHPRSAPEYLRTKLVPDLEQKDAQIQQESAALSASDVDTQITALNDACQRALDVMAEKRRLFEVCAVGRRCLKKERK